MKIKISTEVDLPDDHHYIGMEKEVVEEDVYHLFAFLLSIKEELVARDRNSLMMANKTEDEHKIEFCEKALRWHQDDVGTLTDILRKIKIKVKLGKHKKRTKVSTPSVEG